MSGNKTIITLVLLGVCVALVAGKRHRRGRDHGKDQQHRRGLPSGACLVKNLTSDEIEINKTCGCGDITVPCSWGPLTLTTKSGDTIEATFCDMSAYPLPGLLRHACLAQRSNGEVIRDRNCSKEDGEDAPTCSVGPKDFSVAGDQITATFCTRRPKQESQSGDDQVSVDMGFLEEDDDDEEEDEKPHLTCVNIEKRHGGPLRRKGRDGSQGTRQARGDGQHGVNRDETSGREFAGGRQLVAGEATVQGRSPNFGNARREEDLDQDNEPPTRDNRRGPRRNEDPEDSDLDEDSDERPPPPPRRGQRGPPPPPGRGDRPRRGGRRQ